MKRLSRLALAALVSSTLIFSACSSNDAPENGDQAAAPATEAPALTDLSLEAPVRSRMPNERKETLNAIRAGEPVKFETLTALVLGKHRQSYKARKKPDVAALEQRLSDISSGLDSSDPNELKKAYEARLEKSLERPIQYNSGANNVVHALNEARVQSYSGTVLNQLVTRLLEGSNAFKAKHHVVLFEAGRVLPGYLIEKEGRWHLYGVETTTAGRSIVYYGTTDALDIPIRVIDAEYFILLDVFRDDVKNLKSAAAQAIAKTAKKYALNVEKLEKRIAQNQRESGGRDASISNSSPLAFGKSNDVVPGDQARVTREVESHANDGSFVDPKELLASASTSDSSAHPILRMNFWGEATPYLTTGNMMPGEVDNVHASSRYRNFFPNLELGDAKCLVAITYANSAQFVTGVLLLQGVPSTDGPQGFSISFDDNWRPAEAKVCTGLDKNGICARGYTLTIAPDYSCTLSTF